MRSTMMDLPLTVAAVMRYGASAYAEREVVTATAGGVRRQSYAQTGAEAARLAAALRSLGVDGDQRVATLMWNNAEHLCAYLAIPSMGAVLHTLNLRLDPEVIGYIASHAGDDVVIVDGTLVPLLAQVLPHAPGIRHVIVSRPDEITDNSALAAIEASSAAVHSYPDLLAAAPGTFSWPELDEKSAAAMCYTSGTTGRPKGVVYSHRSMYLHSMAVSMGNVFALSDRDRVLPVVPMFHANAWGLPYAAFLAGADLIMPDRFLQPAPLAALIEAERPTIAGAVPTIWNALLSHVRADGGDLSSLRLVPCGGSAVPHALMEAYEKELGVRIVQAWGMTETSPLGSVAHPPAGLPEPEGWRYRDTQGRLICAVESRLVGEGGTILPHDGVAVGEVEVRGPWITGAYYRDDDPEKFRDGWLRTGDVGTIDRLGFVTLTDRAKDVIKSGGEW
ncbi:MAG TPA: long-chain-fatty-acid--CoA ligase, partial [Streptosporangiaceae bacterium]